ncbi:MAG: hypothetical protein QM820_41245 [Minicystis sp.]
MFQAIYDSPWHNPASFWAAALAFLAVWMRKKPFLVAFFALFGVEILADALATGGWSPLSFHKSPLTTPIAIAFVILGDFRYFLLVERFARRPAIQPAEATSANAWASSAALSFVVPVLGAAANRALPARFSDTRWTFLTYEVIFFFFALALRFLVLPRRLDAVPAAVRAWLLAVTDFEIAQYALWAVSDVIILAGADAGFALRLVPDFMYYAFFLPFVAWKAPAEVDP